MRATLALVLLFGIAAVGWLALQTLPFASPASTLQMAMAKLNADIASSDQRFSQVRSTPTLGASAGSGPIALTETVQLHLSLKQAAYRYAEVRLTGVAEADCEAMVWAIVDGHLNLRLLEVGGVALPLHNKRPSGDSVAESCRQLKGGEILAHAAG